jgi:hypothetical protein
MCGQGHCSQLQVKPSPTKSSSSLLVLGYMLSSHYLDPTGAALGFRLMENGCVQFGIKRTHIIVLLWQS